MCERGCFRAWLIALEGVLSIFNELTTSGLREKLRLALWQKRGSGSNCQT